MSKGQRVGFCFVLFFEFIFVRFCFWHFNMGRNVNQGNLYVTETEVYVGLKLNKKSESDCGRPELTVVKNKRYRLIRRLPNGMKMGT